MTVLDDHLYVRAVPVLVTQHVGSVPAQSVVHWQDSRVRLPGGHRAGVVGGGCVRAARSHG